MPTIKRATKKTARLRSQQRVVGRREWKIWLRHPRMWRGWKHLITMYDCERAAVVAEANSALIYYEGSTDWKITPSNVRLTDRRENK